MDISVFKRTIRYGHYVQRMNSIGMAGLLGTLTENFCSTAKAATKTWVIKSRSPLLFFIPEVNSSKQFARSNSKKTIVTLNR